MNNIIKYESLMERSIFSNLAAFENFAGNPGERRLHTRRLTVAICFFQVNGFFGKNNLPDANEEIIRTSILPNIEATDHGIERRLEVVPFNQTLTGIGWIRA